MSPSLPTSCTTRLSPGSCLQEHTVTRDPSVGKTIHVARDRALESNDKLRTNVTVTNRHAQSCECRLAQERPADQYSAEFHPTFNQHSGHTTGGLRETIAWKHSYNFRRQNITGVEVCSEQ